MLADRKKRKFKESVELQITLRDYDTEKDKRFNSTIKLDHCPKPRLNVAVIGTVAHCD
jgi:large subunit ribosomal protein L10Ae